MADETGGGYPGGKPSEQPEASTQTNQADAESAEQDKELSVNEMKDKGNAAFLKAQLLKKTTAGKQYLDEAKSYYADALRRLSSEQATPEVLALVCTLHSNLAAVFLQEAPPAYAEAKAAAEIALSVNPQHVKALYRRGQASLEDNREGLAEESLRSALADFKTVLEIEPGNKPVAAEAERISRRLAVIEEARRVPPPGEIIEKIPDAHKDRGADLFDTHGYVWGQTESTIHIFVPARGIKTKRSKDVTVEVKANSLQIVVPSKPASGSSAAPGTEKSSDVFELSGRLHKPVRPDDCSWQLEDDGLLLHVELAKRDTESENEHWFRVWANHPETRAPSAEERKKVKDMAQAACYADSRETKQEMPAGAEEKLKGLRDAFPGMNIEWGDTSLDAMRM